MFFKYGRTQILVAGHSRSSYRHVIRSIARRLIDRAAIAGGAATYDVYGVDTFALLSRRFGDGSVLLSVSCDVGGIARAHGVSSLYMGNETWLRHPESYKYPPIEEVERLLHGLCARVISADGQQNTRQQALIFGM